MQTVHRDKRGTTNKQPTPHRLAFSDCSSLCVVQQDLPSFGETGKDAEAKT